MTLTPFVSSLGIETKLSWAGVTSLSSVSKSSNFGPSGRNETARRMLISASARLFRRKGIMSAANCDFKKKERMWKSWVALCIQLTFYPGNRESLEWKAPGSESWEDWLCQANAQEWTRRAFRRLSGPSASYTPTSQRQPANSGEDWWGQNKSREFGLRCRGSSTVCIGEAHLTSNVEADSGSHQFCVVAHHQHPPRGPFFWGNDHFHLPESFIYDGL